MRVHVHNWIFLNGIHFGRPRKLNPEQTKLARRLIDEGQSVREIADTLKRPHRNYLSALKHGGLSNVFMCFVLMVVPGGIGADPSVIAFELLAEFCAPARTGQTAKIKTAINPITTVI
jgi:Helix-turn-helix domain of resolvase